MEEKLKRRNWTEGEILALLNSYSARTAEFTHPQRRKSAWANVLLDLQSQGVLTQPTTEEMLRVKIKNMMHAYKTAVDASKRTGAARVHIPYADQMDQIFGNRPIIASTHLVSVGSGKVAESLSTKPADKLQATASNISKRYQREDYFKDKNAILKHYLEKKLENAKENQVQKKRRHDDKIEIAKQKLALQNKKLKLLEESINKK